MTDFSDNDLHTLNMNLYEYCRILVKGDTTHVQVFKLQPFMSCGKPLKDVPYTLPYRICCNDSSCEPIGNKKCVSKNYMTIKRGTVSPDAKPPEEGEIKRIEVLNSNPREIYYTGVDY